MISKDNDIANELQALVPGAEWPGLKPSFGEAPAGYFEQLPDMILQKVRTAGVTEELETISPLLAAAQKSFTLPVEEGYFERLPEKIMQQIELESISPLLAEIPKIAPLTVPAGYFDGLPDQVMQRIEAQEELEAISPLLAEMPKIAPLATPAGYFDGLPEQVMQRIGAQEELETISPLLAGMSKEHTMSVPAGYFDQFSNTVLAAVQEAPATPKVVRMRLRPYIKWAVAASLITLVSTSTLFFLKNNQQSRSYTEVNLSDISDKEIEDYLQAHMDAFDKEELAGLAPADEAAVLPDASELPAEAIGDYLDNTGLLNESPTDN